ncbi:MAG: hypothetical protein ABFD15_00435 [Methanofastidiosum sp.]
MNKSTAICDVSLFVSKSKYSQAESLMKSLHIEEVIMPEELVDILMKVHRGEELLGEQVRVLSYWAKGPVPKDEEIRTFYETLIEKGIKIRTIKEYVLKKEVELGYTKLREGMEKDEMEAYNKSWRNLYNKFSETMPDQTAIICSKILSLSLVFNEKIVAVNRKLLRFLFDSGLEVSKVTSKIEIDKNMVEHNIIFLNVYGSKTFEPLFYEIKNSIKESTEIQVELEKDVGSIVMFNL